MNKSSENAVQQSLYYNDGEPLHITHVYPYYVLETALSSTGKV